MRFCWLIGCILALASPAFAIGPGWITGKEWHYWTEYGYVVIIGRIQDITQYTDQAGSVIHKAALDPLVTLAGHLDPSERPSLTVHFYVSGLSSMIHEPPPNGSVIMVVMHMGLHVNDEKEPSDWIVSDVCTFMPDRSPICVLKGLDDPRIVETLDRIREARAHPDPSPYPPATRPSATPSTHAGE